MKTNNPLSGLLLIDKEKGISSFRLVHILRKITQVRKIGHAGTLDPIATGLMILLIGKNFTKQSNQFLELDKEYLATLFLGKSTDTHDEEGKITDSSDSIPPLEDIEKALLSFQGEVLQTPPMYSAKKIKGQKLYDLARRGITIEREPVPITLLTTLISYEYPYLTLNIQCSKGTYVRTITDDLGKILKTGAYLYALKRLRIGPFSLKDALSQNQLTYESVGDSIRENPLS